LSKPHQQTGCALLSNLETLSELNLRLGTASFASHLSRIADSAAWKSSLALHSLTSEIITASTFSNVLHASITLSWSMWNSSSYQDPLVQGLFPSYHQNQKWVMLLAVPCLYLLWPAFIDVKYCIALVFKLKFPISLFQVHLEHLGDPFPFKSVFVLFATIISLIRLCYFYLNLIWIYQRRVTAGCACTNEFVEAVPQLTDLEQLA
jgi:hypothetical protein